MEEHPGQSDDVFTCDFCGSVVSGDAVEFRLDVNDIFVFCPNCAQRARELEQSLGPPPDPASESSGGLFDMPPDLLDQ